MVTNGRSPPTWGPERTVNHYWPSSAILLLTYSNISLHGREPLILFDQQDSRPNGIVQHNTKYGNPYQEYESSSLEGVEYSIIYSCYRTEYVQGFGPSFYQASFWLSPS